MLRDTGEEQNKKVRKTRKHRSMSQRQKVSSSRSSNRSERSPKRHRSSTIKRTNSSKLTKEEIKYQRFVRDLKRDIQIHLNQCLRESRFDPCGKQRSPINPSLISKRSTPLFDSPRTNDSTTAVTSSTYNQQRLMKFLKNNETKRLTADVQTLLTGPGFKNFYTHFIQSRQQQTILKNSLRPFEESILLPNEQE
ncbi:unnamed protein product [Rotaria sp. Silwood1]|nr:unnamed protein product [Rotaria sp. Silwood1]CAF3376639.1 unnamed protein product [Rotaria sp. Silwood1]CAF3390029.1 unnamed protein product [Rotaria sp. Silwood1]CAF4622261.1 unnamed protein product [Rotaria sp. Silwood1]CAF4643575.1 unnamed protein product [Rotaria sp. Silwood1]